MSSKAFIWNVMAKRYANQPIADPVAYQKKLEHTQQYFTPESRVLEFGCGTGSTAIYHASKVGHILGVDISDAMLNIARDKKAEAALTNVNFEKCTLLDLENSADWDVILGMSILHLVPDISAHLEKTYELLKPGGVFVSSTMCLGDISTRFKYIEAIFKWVPFLPSVQALSSESLKQIIVKAGFEIEYEWQPGIKSALYLVGRKRK